MRPNPDCPARSGVTCSVSKRSTSKPDLLLNSRQVMEPLPHLVGEPDPREIGVPIPVAKPAAHLQQSVVGRRGSDEERDGQPLERQASRERVAAHGDDDARVAVIEVEALILRRPRVVGDHLRSLRDTGSRAATSCQVDRLQTEVRAGTRSHSSRPQVLERSGRSTHVAASEPAAQRAQVEPGSRQPSVRGRQHAARCGRAPSRVGCPFCGHAAPRCSEGSNEARSSRLVGDLGLELVACRRALGAERRRSRRPGQFGRNRDRRRSISSASKSRGSRPKIASGPM